MPDDIRRYFEAEAQELIDRLTSGVATLGAGNGDAAAVQDMLRAAHTLKGAAHVMGERRMATLAHDFEDGAAAYRSGPSAEQAGALLALVDALAKELAGGSAGRADGRDTSVGVTGPQETSTPDEAAAVRRENEVMAAGVAPFRAPQTVRVGIAETAKLLDGIGASGALVGSMRGVLAGLEAVEETGTAEARRAQRSELRRRLGDHLDRLARSMAEMHQVAAGLRLGTTEALLLEAGRVVRATAATLGKEAVCLTRGERERVEMPILDALGDALLHLVRNAVAHGIGSVAARVAKGKPGVATVRVEVRREGTDVVFTCADDGRGIAVEPIRQAAVARGEMTAEVARGASDEELLHLLMRPGFSMSAVVDEISGRGVGLDAVREAAERVRGEVRIESTAGKGTTFTIRVPQALFAVEALEVEANGMRYLLPLRSVEQTFVQQAHHIRTLGGTQTLLMGRETMGFFRLQDAFAARDEARREVGPEMCVVLATGGRRMALGVERIGVLQEVLVQALPGFVGAAPYVAGTALSASGVPQMVLDAGELITFAESGSATLRQAASSFAAPSVRKPVLVIDDSLTTRMLEQSILEAEGYEVELATSAEMGLAKAREREYGLFLVDVEMPGMNGFEFVALTRADARLRETPAILVTSLDSAEHRERGRVAGAYSYIVKGEFNQQIYLDRIRSVMGGEA